MKKITVKKFFKQSPRRVAIVKEIQDLVKLKPIPQAKVDVLTTELYKLGPDQ